MHRLGGGIGTAVPVSVGDLVAGDLLALAETSADGIEWLVLETTDGPATSRDSAVRTVRVVAADSAPFVGVDDLDLDEVLDGALGALVVRCGVTLSLDAAIFDAAVRSARLDADTLQRVVTRVHAVAAAPTHAAERDEAELEHLEAVVAARDRLDHSARAAVGA
ncbi:MAG: hypothetical protein AAGC60_18930 [Acidobacteriota bacterium]